MREYGFELRLAAHLERDGLPGLEDVRPDGILARQLGTSVTRAGGRVVDLVYVEPGPEFRDRVELSPETIPPAAIESQVGIGRFRSLTDSIDASPEHARRVGEAAVEAGFFEAERDNGQTVVRQTARYPNWYGRLVGIENKPDLATPGDLSLQLRQDVSLGALDAVILATQSYVTRAHLNRLPDPVGVWRVDFDEPDPIAVIREPTMADSSGDGIEVLATYPGRTDLEPVRASAIERQRRRVSERAYGKGWRTYSIPGCKNAVSSDAAGASGLPGCHWNERLVDPASECGNSCAGYEPASPPSVDLETERERRTSWVADPPGKKSEQSSVSDFVSEM